MSKPTKLALSAQSLRATSSSSASGDGAFSLSPSKYFPETLSSSSATARYVLGWAASWGLLNSSQKKGPTINHRTVSQKKKERKRERRKKIPCSTPSKPLGMEPSLKPHGPTSTPLSLQFPYLKVPSLVTSKTKPPERDEHKSASYRKPPQGFQKNENIFFPILSLKIIFLLRQGHM